MGLDFEYDLSVLADSLLPVLVSALVDDMDLFLMFLPRQQACWRQFFALLVFSCDWRTAKLCVRVYRIRWCLGSAGFFRF